MEQNNQTSDVDISAMFGGESKGVQIDESARLVFGKQVLLCLAVICVGVFAGYAYAPENKALASIFELIKIGALPLVTLVISFYFPSNNGASK
ncbi:hypothetical protein [Zooshikella ganghwensis]|uniref:hypothetical protein n=1 Tax=Zooshikella ganghwensis TaxID=202772 RepID=UPI00041A2AB6|nr:hypothetical protein [Zooshikella ganghwensis]